MEIQLADKPTSTTDLYSRISSAFLAMENCERTNNQEWLKRHEETICDLVKEHCPSGSGFDHGTQFDFENSKPERLVFLTAYHHMNDGGMYDGWSNYRVIITPSLAFGYEINVAGRDRNGIKEYVAETFTQLI